MSRRSIPPMAVTPLNFAAGPLVWVDCEMTGLNHKTDKIIEIAVRVEVKLDILALKAHTGVGPHN